MIRPTLTIALLTCLMLCLVPATGAANSYETAMVGTWEISGETDLFVLDKKNSCYRVDEDGIKTSRRGRWAADSRRLTMELKYNGKKFRSVFAYKKVNNDLFELTIVKAFVDGKPKVPKTKKVTAKRRKK